VLHWRTKEQIFRNIFITTFSESLLVVSNRLIGRRLRGNLGSFPDYGKAIIFTFFQDLGKWENRMQWLNRFVRCTSGLLGSCLRHSFKTGKRIRVPHVILVHISVCSKNNAPITPLDRESFPIQGRTECGLPLTSLSTAETYHPPPDCAHNHGLVCRLSVSVDEYQRVQLFPHGWILWHISASYAPQCQTIFCQTVPLILPVSPQQNLQSIGGVAVQTCYNSQWSFGLWGADNRTSPFSLSIFSLNDPEGASLAMGGQVTRFSRRRKCVLFISTSDCHKCSADGGRDPYITIASTCDFPSYSQEPLCNCLSRMANDIGLVRNNQWAFLIKNFSWGGGDSDALPGMPSIN
jgi:hypothetical protein